MDLGSVKSENAGFIQLASSHVTRLAPAVIGSLHLATLPYALEKEAAKRARGEIRSATEGSRLRLLLKVPYPKRPMDRKQNAGFKIENACSKRSAFSKHSVAFTVRY